MFVSHTHGVWITNDRRKPSKRYGQLVQSPRSGLSEMLMHHKEEVFRWIEEKADVRDSDETEEEERPKSRSPRKSPTKRTA